MKIKIIDKEEGQNLFIWLPTRLLINGFFAAVSVPFINIEFRKRGTDFRLSGKSCRKLIREFYRIRKHFGGRLDLVEVESKDGSRVKIVL